MYLRSAANTCLMGSLYRQECLHPSLCCSHSSSNVFLPLSCHSPEMHSAVLSNCHHFWFSDTIPDLIQRSFWQWLPAFLMAICWISDGIVGLQGTFPFHNITGNTRATFPPSPRILLPWFHFLKMSYILFLLACMSPHQLPLKQSAMTAIQCNLSIPNDLVHNTCIWNIALHHHLVIRWWLHPLYPSHHLLLQCHLFQSDCNT